MEEIRTGLRGGYRLILFILIISGFLIWSYFCHLFIRDPDKRIRTFSNNSRFTSGIMLKVFNCQVKYTNRPGDSEKFLAVSNHMGFVDILMLASCFPVVFVTSNEMKETPFLGLLTEMAGCMYVERRSRTKILEEMKSIGAVLKRGYRVVLYPEATSTNGEKVLPFKKTLIMAAAHAGVPIQPIVINFRKINGEEFSLKWRDHVCWYGDIPFVTAMWKSLTLKSVEAEVEFLEKIYCTTDDDRGLIADKAHALISAKFVPVKGAPQEPTAAIEFETEST